MYRKPKTVREESGNSFDSLLDTMTNVVGILVILLAVTQIGVREAMQRIQANLPDISPEMLQAAKDRNETLQAELADLALPEANPDAPTPTPEELAELRTETARLEEEKSLLPALENPAPLLKDVETLRKEVEQASQHLVGLQETWEKLRARLATIPLRRAPPARVVRLPDPRPAPAKAKPIYVLCRYNRVAMADIDALRETAGERVRAVKNAVVYRPPAAAGGRTARKAGASTVYDPEKVTELFKRQAIGTRDFQLGFRFDAKRRWKHLQIAMRPNGGEALTQLRYPGSALERTLRAQKDDQHYVRFMVWPDGFEAYLAARDIADRLGIPAGWHPLTEEVWNVSFASGFTFHGQLPPPPKPDTPPPPAPKPNVLD